MRIVSRAEWGAKPWVRARPVVPLNARRYVVFHYHGGPVAHQVGVAVPKTVEAIHLANGWSGVGYSFVVDQAGTIYEGHGWNLQGAHSPPHNRDGFGIYFAVGGDQKPSEAALRAGRWLYDEANRRTGRKLTPWWHGRDFPTSCPGPHLIAWVKAGMPTSSKTSAGAGLPASNPTTNTRIDLERLLETMDEKDLQKLIGDTVYVKVNELLNDRDGKLAKMIGDIVYQKTNQVMRDLEKWLEARVTPKEN